MGESNGLSGDTASQPDARNVTDLLRDLVGVSVICSSVDSFTSCMLVSASVTICNEGNVFAVSILGGGRGESNGLMGSIA
jgi:hypothetical protein